MFKLLSIVFSILLVCLTNAQDYHLDDQAPTASSPAALLQQPQAQVKRFQEKYNHFYYYGKLNEPFEIPSPSFEFNEEEISWALDNNDKVLKIYYSNKLEQADNFMCSPSDKCLGLKINSLKKEFTGDYLRKSASVDGKTSTNTEYDVLAYDPVITVICVTASETDKCDYDPKTQTITIRENVDVTIDCRTTLYNGSDATATYQIEHHFREQNKCQEDDPSKKKNRNNEVVFENNEIKVRKECLQSFRRNDETYSCTLRTSTEDQNDKMYKPDINRIDIKLNIKYPPGKNEVELNSTVFQLTVSQGTTKTLSCPYDGNPIEYIWRLVKNNSTEELGKSKTLSLPKTLAQGVHTIECTAFMPGDLKTMQKPYEFTVNVTKNTAAEKKNKIYLIAAGVVGGVILLLVIVIIIVVVSRKGKSKKRDVPQPRSSRKQQSDPAESRPLN